MLTGVDATYFRLDVKSNGRKFQDIDRRARKASLSLAESLFSATRRRGCYRYRFTCDKRRSVNRAASNTEASIRGSRFRQRRCAKVRSRATITFQHLRPTCIRSREKKRRQVGTKKLSKRARNRRDVDRYQGRIADRPTSDGSRFDPRSPAERRYDLRLFEVRRDRVGALRLNLHRARNDILYGCCFTAAGASATAAIGACRGSPRQTMPRENRRTQARKCRMRISVEGFRRVGTVVEICKV